MNIDVRNIKGEVLKCMEKIIQKHNFATTSKATRFVIVDYFKKLETIRLQEKKIENLEKKLMIAKEEIEEIDSFRYSLNQFLKFK